MAKTSGDYQKSRVKPWGAAVSGHQFWGFGPNDLLQPGDGIRLATRARLLIKVTPSKTHPDTISYVAKIFPLDEIKPSDKVYGGGESNLSFMGC
jgi:hypothetical protein